MWKYIKQLWDDYCAAENELAEMGIIRIYSPYGIIDYYDVSLKKKRQ